MSNAPYGVRLLVGVAATAIEETQKLPQTILTYPMTVISQMAHLVMKVQQDVADLVIRGDAALEQLFPPKDEQPEWATFDEDESSEAAPVSGSRRTEGRFALYSSPDAAETESPATPTSGGNGVASDDILAAPTVAEEIEYETLTLAQLRARLQSLPVAELEELLAYEEATKARAPFQTLLANRITRASAK